MTAREKHEKNIAAGLLFPAHLPEQIPVQHAAALFGVSSAVFLSNPVNCQSSSLFFMSVEHPVRRLAIAVTFNWYFRAAVLLWILLNTVAMTIREHVQSQGGDTYILEVFDDVTLCVFVGEMLIKIVALGLVCHRQAYLRDAWNVLDAIVVLSAVGDQLDITADSALNGAFALVAFRVLRVLRPLRTISSFSALREIVTRLFACLPSVGKVALMLTVLMWLVAAVGLLSMSTALDGRCFADITSAVPMISQWASNCSQNASSPLTFVVIPVADAASPSSTFVTPLSDTRPCGLQAGVGRSCKGMVDVTFSCPDQPLWSPTLSNGTAWNGGILSFAVSCMSKRIVNDPTWPDTILDFSNMYHALLVSFKLACRDNWPDQYRALADGAGVTQAFFFTFSATLLMGYFCVSLFTAVFESSFSTMEMEESVRHCESSAGRSNAGLPSTVTFATVLGASVVGSSAAFSCCFLPSDGTHAHDPTFYDLHAHRLRQLLTSATVAHDEHVSLHRYFEKEEDHRGLEGPLVSVIAHNSGSQQRSSGTRRMGMFRDRCRAVWRRASRLSGVPRVRSLVLSVQYNLFTLMCVFANVVALATITSQSVPNHITTVQWISFAFGIVFIVDAALKLVGLGVSYFKSPLNCLDFVLTMGSLPEVASLGSDSTFTALRAFRVVRLMRLGRRWRNFRNLLQIIGDSLGKLLSVSMVGFMVMLCFTLLGYELFAGYTLHDSLQFSSVGQAFLAVFISVTGEDQNEMYDDLSRQGRTFAPLFFVALTLFGNFIWANLFTSVILDSFASFAEDGFEEHILEKEGETKSAALGVNDAAWNYEKWIDTLLDRKVDELVRVVSTRVGNPIANFFAPITSKSAELTGGDAMEVSMSLMIRDADVVGRGEGERDDGPHSHVNVCEHHATKTAYVPSKASGDHNDVTHGAASHRTDGHVGTTNASPAPEELQFTTTRTEPRSMGGRTRRDRGNSRVNALFRPAASSVSLTEMRILHKDWGGLQFPSLWLRLPPSHAFRSLCVRMIKHAAFDWASLILTLTSSVLLALDRPGQEAGTLKNVISISDVLFCVLFSMECIVKIVALGFAQHKGAFLRSSWNCLDALQVFCSIAALFYTPLKFVRSLRIVRILNVSFTLRVVTRSLISAIPQMGVVVIFVAMLNVMWSIVGLELYRSKFDMCTDTAIRTAEACVGDFVVPDPSPFNGWQNSTSSVVTRTWLPSDPSTSSFNSFYQAMYTLFKMSCTDGWFKIMFTAMNAHGTSSFVAGLFFVSYMIVGKFFAVQLFVGVLVERFVLQRQRGEGYALLSESQAQWVFIQKVLLRSDVKLNAPRPTVRRLRAAAYDMVNHKWFDYASLIMNTLNAVAISLYGTVAASSEFILDDLGLVLLAFMLFEILLRLTAMGPRGFLQRKRNLLDLVVVGGSSIAVLINSDSSSSIERVFRGLRLLTFLHRIPGIKLILSVFVQAIPELANVTVLLMSIYFVYAVIGVQLFHSADHSNPLSAISRSVNFSDVWHAMASLYIMMTEENWAEITDGLADVSHAAFPYAISFMIFGCWIGSHLIVTVVIDTFVETEETIAMGDSIRVLDNFRQRWISYDPDGTRLLLSTTVIQRIFPFLSAQVWDSSTAPVSSLCSVASVQHATKRSPFLATLNQLQRMHLPIDEEKRCRYEDCLASVAMRLFSLEVTEALVASQRAVHGVVWRSDEYCAHHEFAAVLLTRVARRWLARRQLHASRTHASTGV